MSWLGSLLMRGARSITRKASLIVASLSRTMMHGCGDGTSLAAALTSAVAYSTKEHIHVYNSTMHVSELLFFV